VVCDAVADPWPSLWQAIAAVGLTTGKVPFARKRLNSAITRDQAKSRGATAFARAASERFVGPQAARQLRSRVAGTLDPRGKAGLWCESVDGSALG